MEKTCIFKILLAQVTHKHYLRRLKMSRNSSPTSIPGLPPPDSVSLAEARRLLRTARHLPRLQRWYYGHACAMTELEREKERMLPAIRAAYPTWRANVCRQAAAPLSDWHAAGMLFRILKSLPESTARQLIGLFRVGNSGLADKLATAAAEPNSDDFHQMAKEEGLASIHAQLALRFVLLAADALVVALRQAGEEIAPDVEIDLASDVDALIAECAAAFPETNVDDFRIYLAPITKGVLRRLAADLWIEYIEGNRAKLGPFFNLDQQKKEKLTYCFAVAWYSEKASTELYMLLMKTLPSDGQIPEIYNDPDESLVKVRNLYTRYQKEPFDIDAFVEELKEEIDFSTLTFKGMGSSRRLPLPFDDRNAANNLLEALGHYGYVDTTSEVTDLLRYVFGLEQTSMGGTIVWQRTSYSLQRLLQRLYSSNGKIQSGIYKTAEQHFRVIGKGGEKKKPDFRHVYDPKPKQRKPVHLAEFEVEGKTVNEIDMVNVIVEAAKP